MEPTSAISMSMIVTTLISTIFLFSFASEAPVYEDSKLANADDFSASGLHASRLPLIDFNVSYIAIDARKVPALKSIGMSALRVDFEPLGRSSIHFHPQSAELINVLEGTFYVGFLMVDPMDLRKSQLVSKILNPGDVFVVPQGRIHFLYNMGHNVSATVFQCFNNMNIYEPNMIPNQIIASYPPIDNDFLAKSFRVDESTIELLRKQFP